MDVSVLGAILLHLANPFAALRQAAAITNDVIIVTDLHARHLGEHAVLEFSPYPEGKDPGVWWLLTPGVSTVLTAVGFPNHSVSFHEHRRHNNMTREEFSTSRRCISRVIELCGT